MIYYRIFDKWYVGPVHSGSMAVEGAAMTPLRIADIVVLVTDGRPPLMIKDRYYRPLNSRELFEMQFVALPLPSNDELYELRYDRHV